ncbi:MAG: DUF819 family protein [Bacteroidetes bacterium]|nr:DUF819 family protein [Bacteroidota bacterium]
MPLQDPLSLVAFLLALVAGIFYLSRVQRLDKLFAFVPPVLWCYFVPMLLTTFGILPPSSPVYDWMSGYGLLVALFLLMVTSDVRAILRLGPRAGLMMLAGTIGIVIGGIVAFSLFKGLLPADAWMGFGALSGSWIGGTANMVAVKEGLGAPDSVLAPIIVVDTVVGYGWMGLLLFLSRYQHRFDAWTKADPALLARLETTDFGTTERRPTTTADLAIIVGLALGVAVAIKLLSAHIPTLDVSWGGRDVTIISRSTWAILLVVTAGLTLSFTPVRKLDEVGGSAVGNYALYALLATIGAQADLAKVAEFPAYMLAGALWLSIHVGVMVLAAKMLRAPLFLLATGSMANVGGAASAPIVATTYHRTLAPVGLVMAVAGYILGIYFGFLTANILGLIAGR